MKKNLVIILSAALVMIASDSQAQKSTKQLSFGFGVEGGIVTGKVKDLYSSTAGFTGRGSYRVGPGFATLTAGAMVLLPKSLEGEDISAGLIIPVKAGYKYLIGDHFFVMGELGYSNLRIYESSGATTYTEGGFTYAPAIGVQFGTFEIGARYESTALQGVTLSAAILRLGWNF